MALKQADILRSNNPKAYGIVPAIEVAGHKSVAALTALYALADPILSLSGTNAGNDALGQEWYVVSAGKKYRLKSWADRKSASGWEEVKATVTKSDVGLGNVDNVKQIPASEKGALNGVAELDESGKVPTSQLPSYVDDVVEFGGTVAGVTVTVASVLVDTDKDYVVYDTTAKCFLLRQDKSTGGLAPGAADIKYYPNWGGGPDTSVAPAESYGEFKDGRWVPVSGKIYVGTESGKTYRWSGSDLVEIGGGVALGETSSTAYRGDRGKVAYDHAQAKGSAFASGLYKITTNAQGHVTAAAAVAKADITGLGIPAQDTTYTAATSSKAGLMSAADKSKLDGLEATSALTTAEIDALFA